MKYSRISKREMDAYREMIRENIDYDGFVRERLYDAGQLDEMVELMVEAVCSQKGNAPGGGERLPSGGGEVPAAEAGPGPHRFCVRLPQREHHAGAEHEAIPADGAV